MTHYGPRVRSPDGSLQTVTADEGPPPRDRIPPSEIDIDAGMVRELLKSQHPDLARGKLTSVLDWGDMTVGDPATDLAAAWMLFPTDADGAVWSACGEVTPHTLTRAAGWAVYFGVTVLDSWLPGDPLFRPVRLPHPGAGLRRLTAAACPRTGRPPGFPAPKARRMRGSR